jgi:multidrug efflux pump subunit AcrB
MNKRKIQIACIVMALLKFGDLLGRNAIFIAEFDALKHRENLIPLKAAIAGATVRLRPLLMTSFEFMAGLIPLIFASGAVGCCRQPYRWSYAIRNSIRCNDCTRPVFHIRYPG